MSFPNIAQVWRATDSVGSGTDERYFAINSIRQITNIPLSLAPAFGGLVIGQVGTPIVDGNGDVTGVSPLPVGSGVYFGEWAKSISSPAGNGADLNMTDSSRTVWYVGDDAVSSTPNLDNVKYNVIGINRTGTDASGTTLIGGLPGSPNFYKGTLTANYSTATSTGNITGTLARTGSTSLDFAGTSIGSNGTFANTDPNKNIEGRFYNGAEALAGIYKGPAASSAADSVAFGGSKVSGTITQ